MDDERNDRDTRPINVSCIASVAGIMVASAELVAPIPRERCWTSNLTGHKYIMETLEGHDARCMSVFRMKKTVFLDLCHTLATEYGLEASRDIGLHEMVGMFVYTVAQGVGNRTIQDRFQHSGETVHRQFHSVLQSLLRLADTIIKPRDPEFSAIPPKILNDSRYWPYFRDCIGAIDGTHIQAIVPPDQRQPYVGRKGVTTQNVMAVCDFDMLFTFVCAGWEGSAHDARILTEVIGNGNMGFPHPPPGKYYLVDAGYPNKRGYLAPYKGERYHLEVFRRAPHISGPREAFNHAHSSLRSVIERCFGVLKKKWLILTRMPSYPFDTQVRIVVACIALHNFIRRHVMANDDFDEYTREALAVYEGEGNLDAIGIEGETHLTGDREMNIVRDLIAAELFHI